MASLESPSLRVYVVLNPVRAKTVKHPREWNWSSYRATAGLATVPPWPTSSEVLSHFGQRRKLAQQKYRRYVEDGIGSASIWEQLEAQSLLGLEGFAAALTSHVAGKRKVREIPKGQRLVGRPSLKQLFEEIGTHKVRRDRRIAEAVEKHGYGQIEIARHLGLHYSTVSRLIKGVTQERQ